MTTRRSFFTALVTVLVSASTRFVKGADSLDAWLGSSSW